MIARAKFDPVAVDGVVVHLPRPMTHDLGEIGRGLDRAHAMYDQAADFAGRVAALRWINHWRQMKNHAKAFG